LLVEYSFNFQKHWMIFDKLKQDETLPFLGNVQRPLPKLSFVGSGGTLGPIQGGTRCLQRVGKRMRLGRLIYFRAFVNSRSPPVRAGLAFSGEADPPLKMRATLSLRRLIWLALHMKIAIRNTFCAL
jgi:hypothetical protein